MLESEDDGEMEEGAAIETVAVERVGDIAIAEEAEEVVAERSPRKKQLWLVQHLNRKEHQNHASVKNKRNTHNNQECWFW